MSLAEQIKDLPDRVLDSTDFKQEDLNQEKRRCKAITKSTLYQKSGQCQHSAVNGSDFCAIHLGRKRGHLIKSPYLNEIIQMIILGRPAIFIHEELKKEGFYVSYVNLTKYIKKQKEILKIY